MGNPESFKDPLSPEGIATALDALEPGSPEAQELMGKWADLCHEVATREAAAQYESREVSNRSSIEAEIQIAIPLLSSRNYADLARESLLQTLESAIQDPSTADLEEKIRDLLNY